MRRAVPVAFCYVSNSSLYHRLEPDHRHKESDGLGGWARYRPAYTLSKIVTEGTVRALANLLGLPTTIARMNVGYGPYAWGGVPVQDFKLMLAGTPIKVPAEYENWCMPIHTDDVTRQVPLLWGVASVPATIVNWGGDDMVSHREMMEFVSEITGVPVEFDPGESPRETFAFDNTRRIALIGRCDVGWRDGVRRTIAAHFPDAIRQ
jgi:nucleoside-diphosphate-sugar epimerase